MERHNSTQVSVVDFFTNLQSRWQSLQDSSQKFGIDLRYMPTFMKRRKKNTSCYITREDVILWRLEWIFQFIYTTPAKTTPMVVENAKVRGNWTKLTPTHYWKIPAVLGLSLIVLLHDPSMHLTILRILMWNLTQKNGQCCGKSK